MRRAVLAATTFVAACVLAVSAVQPREAVTVSPSFGIAGHYGTWTITYTVGTGGIAPGGALRLQLPDTWHAGERNSANRLQASDPTDDHYIAAYGSGADVRIEAEVESETSDFLVKSARPGLDGRSERYVFVVRANVVSGSLREGETISTLHAYEASFPAPWGHHNVYFRGEPGPLLSPNQVTLPELWAALTAGEALTIPHHTNKFPQPLAWDEDDPALRRNFEIYSAHGLSEAYDPGHPLSFEQSEFTNRSTSARTGVSAQDAWMQGLRLSTIAASDDHRSQPGKPHWGLAAVRAPELTREAVFDALHARRTYGTTGQRILLDFRVNDAPMGSEIALEAPLPEPCAGTSPECGERAAVTAALAPRFEVTAHGTDVIEAVEILRYSEPDGGFRVIHDLRPNALDFNWSGRDGGFRDDAIYYLRLRQRSPVRGRIAMAWSSPVWVNAR